MLAIKWKLLVRVPYQLHQPLPKIERKYARIAHFTDELVPRLFRFDSRKQLRDLRTAFRFPRRFVCDSRHIPSLERRFFSPGSFGFMPLTSKAILNGERSSVSTSRWSVRRARSSSCTWWTTGLTCSRTTLTSGCPTFRRWQSLLEPSWRKRAVILPQGRSGCAPSSTTR